MSGGEDRQLPTRQVRVERALREDIRQGKPPLGGLIPPKRELVDRFSVSPGVIEKAIQQLKDEGVLIGEKGIGVRVTSIPAGIERPDRPTLEQRVTRLELRLDAMEQRDR